MADAALSFPRFRSRLPWWGRDLQTLRNYIVSIESSLAPYPAERVEFAMTDGDRLLASLHRPAEDLGRPLVVLIHGLTGSEDSAYIRASALYFLDQGYPVLRLNLRGAGPSKGVCRSRYHAGRSDDLRQVLGQMDGRLAGKGLLLVGYSLGGNLLLKYLGEAGRRAIVRGAVSISAPIDLDAARRTIMRRATASITGISSPASSWNRRASSSRQRSAGSWPRWRPCSISTTASWHRSWASPMRWTTTAAPWPCPCCRRSACRPW
jgi:Predicted hydrolase of the alpha/beta-hydrolase fold